MAAARRLQRAAVALSLSLAAACYDDPLIGELNELPVADAKVLLSGVAMEQARDDSIAALSFPFSGEPVSVTLDGTSSRDPDGQIAGYRWLSDTRIADAAVPRPWAGMDAGAADPYWRWAPPGEAAGWPLDTAAPTVQLGEGTWTFTLWVVDDRGAWSSPDSIRFTIGAPGSASADAGTPRVVSGIDGGLVTR